MRAAGPAIREQRAVRYAGNRGLLDLTVDDPAKIVEQTDNRLAAKEGILTFRNTSPPEKSRSLVTDSIPAALAVKFMTDLARGRPNEAGEFVISFKNPPQLDLVRGKHQVIFQVFVGESQEPIRERIFRQLDIEEGRYEVPITIQPELIDDSRVSITFVTVQPDHDAWVKTFFDQGRRTNYRGVWSTDGDFLPAIPIAPPPGDHF